MQLSQSGKNMPATPLVSLYDDWCARRERLASPMAQANLPSVAAHVKVLEYLLSRYRHAEFVHCPAVFPLPRGLALNGRAIILNHHLGSGRVAGVKSAQEAQSRMASILQRMAAPAAPSPADDAPWPGMSTIWTRATSRARHREENCYLALASEDYDDRARALNHIVWYGTLQDTGLLSDLAAIPGDEDLLARERREILLAMRLIGRRCQDPRIAGGGRGD